MSGRRAQSVQPHMLEPAKPERGRCVTAICFSWKVITCIVSHVTLVLLVVSYCVGGAYLFSHFEKPHEIEVKKDIHRMRLNLTEKIWNHSDNLTYLNEATWIKVVKDDLQLFEKQILTAIKSQGWDGDEDETKSQWTFAGSLFYSIIVITTIGYGHISPRTDFGKVSTIFYAIIGIPLMLLCLSNIGDVMATSFRFIYWRVCCYVCTRKSKKSRGRSRQRSVRGHRNASRSQPPPTRRSIKISQRTGGGGLQHAYSDPELRTAGRHDYDRDFEYDRNDRRMNRSEARGGSDRRRDHREQSMMMAPPHSRGSTRHLPPYEEHHYLPDEGPSYTQTLRGGRFSSRQRNRDRLKDRHTVERERHLSRSKHHFDSEEDLEEFPLTKRAMSVRSARTPNLRRDEISRESRESKALNRLNSQQGNMLRGKSMPYNNARTRAKSVDPRLSAAHYEDVDEEVIRKTPIISNRYAITEMDHRESRNKNYLRSQSMPRSAFQKHYSNNHHSSRHYQDELPNHVNNHHNSGNTRHHSGYANTNHQPIRSSLGRQTSLGPPITNSRYGNHLDLPEFNTSHGQRMKKGPSPRRHDIYEEDYEDTHHEDPGEHIHMNRRDVGGDGVYDDRDYPSRKPSSRRKRSPRKEKSERLPPSPRIMSPMGFAVKRQVRRRPSYDYDEDSQYGEEWNEYYGDLSPKDRPVPIWLCVFLVVSYILAGASLFHFWEGWSFLDAAYFCFITLTTIGFGDFVPAKGVQDESQQSIAYCSLYLLFGIALLAMSFNLVQEEFIANVKQVARRLGILKDEDDEED